MFTIFNCLFMLLQQRIPQWPEPIIPHLKVMWRVRQQRRVVLETIPFRLFYLQLLILSTPLLVPFYNPTNKNVVLWLFIWFFFREMEGFFPLNLSWMQFVVSIYNENPAAVILFYLFVIIIFLLHNFQKPDRVLRLIFFFRSINFSLLIFMNDIFVLFSSHNYIFMVIV